MTDHLEEPADTPKSPLWDVKPNRVSTGDILLRVMLEDTRSTQAFIARTKGVGKKKGFSQLAVFSIFGGGILAGLHKVIDELSDLEEADFGTPDSEEEPPTVEATPVKKDVEDVQPEKPKQDQNLEPGFWKKLFGASNETKNKETKAKVTIRPEVEKLHAEVDAKHAPKKTLPKPSADVDRALRKVANERGVEYATLYALAGSESSFRSSVSASTSSATGLMQFTTSTWSGMLKSYPELGYTQADRTDPEKSATMAVLYLTTIKKQLTQKLGRTPTLGELYLGYFLGPTGASRFLKALQENPNQKGATLFPSAAKANKNLFYDGKTPLTLQETFQRVSKKITGFYIAGKQVEEPSFASAQETAPPVAVSKAPVTPSVERTPSISVAQSKPKPVAITATEDGPQETVMMAEDSPVQDQQRTLIIPRSSPPPDSVTYIRDKQGRLYQMPLS